MDTKLKNNDSSNSVEKKILNVSFEVKQIDNTDPDFFIFEGLASTFGNVDLGDDIVERGAFAESLVKNPSVPILWQHSMSEPIGKSIELFEDGVGLRVKAKLPKKDDLVKGRVIPQMEIGSITEMSIGFRIIDAKEEVREETFIRILTKIELLEISLVTKAMNPQAVITDFKSVDEVKSDIRDVEKYLKSKGLSQKESKGIISKIKDISKQCDVVDYQREVGEQLEEIKESQELSAIKNLLT